jgi:2-polyprenyl-3-methyl-5-hydroxy-6-metoxy-1,4-benzoquinol methylase
MNTPEPKRAVLLCRSATVASEEWAWGSRLCEELLRGKELQEQVLVLDQSQPLTVGTALATTSAQHLGIVFDDRMLWGLSGWDSLQAILDSASHISAVAPVSNEALVSQQKVTPPFLYSTPSLLRQVAHAHYQQYCQQWSEVAEFDPFAFLVRRTALSHLDTCLPLAQVPQALTSQGGRLAIVLDTYVHRYAPVYEQVRPDIQECVPTDARHILDVGCAAGLFGATLKQRQECHVTGIELSTALAGTAATRLDRVLVANVETLPPTTFTQEFDCITCGDVLEHLRDPWAMVAKCAAWLRPGGRLIATTPNIGHWSIVRDLLHGRWDIVPFSLLSWEHVRFFTRPGIEQLFHGCGFTLERLHGMVSEISSIGEAFLQQAVTLVPGADLESLRTHEFLIVARKG